MRTRQWRVVLAVLGLVVGAAGPAGAGPITGFSGFQLNGDATVDSGKTTLTLTNGNFVVEGSGFYLTPQTISAGFQAQFTYQETPGPVDLGFNPADGVTFVLQNDPAGASALGGPGSSLGYSGIIPSAAVELNAFNGFGSSGRGTQLATQGSTGIYISTAPVDLGSGDQIRVTLSYDAATTKLTETLLDLATHDSFTIQYVQDLAAAVGGDTALIGFTGSSGLGAATQTVTDFSFTAVPEPSTLVMAGSAALSGAGYALRRLRKTA